MCKVCNWSVNLLKDIMNKSLTPEQLINILLGGCPFFGIFAPQCRKIVENKASILIAWI